MLGKTLRVNGQPATIVGVMPEGMKFPDNTEIWAPFMSDRRPAARNARPLRVFGRLSDGADRREAQAEMSGIARQLADRVPRGDQGSRRRPRRNVHRAVHRRRRAADVLTVMGAVVFVLLIACANVANLLLSRSAYRAREIAVRIAMGATRWRVVRQLLIESVVLGVHRRRLGLVLRRRRRAGVRRGDAARRCRTGSVFTVDYVVFAYVAAICVLTAVLFGLAPALHVSRTNNNDVLKEGGRGSTGSRRVRRFSSAMVVAELALTIVLLVGAGSMVRSFLTLYAVDLGIDIDRLMTMRVQLPATKYADAGGAARLLRAARAAARGDSRRRGRRGHDRRAAARRRRAAARDRRPARDPRTPSGVCRHRHHQPAVLRRGRRPPGPRPRLSTTRTARPAPRPSSSTSGWRRSSSPARIRSARRLRFTQRRAGARASPPTVWRTIVGISADDQAGLADRRYVNAVVYIPYRQESPAAASLLVRSALPPASVMDAVRREVQAIDPDQPVLAIQTLAQVLADDRWWYRTWSGDVRRARRDRAGAVVGGPLRGDGVRGDAADAGDRRAHGARRAAAAGVAGWSSVAASCRSRPASTCGFGDPRVLRRVLPAGMVGITPHDPIAIAGIALLLTVVSIAACLRAGAARDPRRSGCRPPRGVTGGSGVFVDRQPLPRPNRRTREREE